MRSPGTHLAEDQQALLLFLTGGQRGKLLQLQGRRRRGDVQVVLEGLEDGAGREAGLVLPVADDAWGGTRGEEGGEGWGRGWGQVSNLCALYRPHITGPGDPLGASCVQLGKRGQELKNKHEQRRIIKRHSRPRA